MAKTSGASLGELMTIRDILMGEIIEEYNGRFAQVEKELAAQKKALAEKEALLNERLNALDQLLQNNTAQLKQALQEKSDSDRSHIGELLSSLGAELIAKASEASK